MFNLNVDTHRYNLKKYPPRNTLSEEILISRRIPPNAQNTQVRFRIVIFHREKMVESGKLEKSSS